jgi:hypothetical protein
MDEEDKEAMKALKGKFDAEHDKHTEAFGKAIEEFKSAAEADHGEEEGHAHEDAIEDFKDAVDGEHDRHEKAHKAIVKAASDPHDEGEDTEEKKGVCKSCGAKGVPGTVHKSCPKHKGAVEDIFMMGAEQREKQERLGFVQSVIWALCDAVWQADVEDFFELLEEAIEIIENYAEHEKNGETDAEEEAEGQSQGKRLGAYLSARIKSGRKISAATEKAIKAVCDALEEHHEQHGEDMEKAIADLKAIAEGPGEGEDGEKAAPNAKVGTLRTNPMREGLDSVSLVRDLLREVNSSSAKGLEKLNEKFGRHFGGRR